MSGSFVRRCALLGALVASAAPQPAKAQTGVSVRTQLGSRQVQAGESFLVQMTALSSEPGDAMSNPRLSVPTGVMLQGGPSVSTQSTMSIINGRIEQRRGITASWTLTAAQPGRYRIGPSSVIVNGRRVTGDVVNLEVLPAGSLSQRPSRGFPFGSFGFPNFPFPGLDDDQPSDQAFDQLPPVPEELKVDRAKDSIAFLNAAVDKQRVVVGEQLTLRIVAYGARGPFQEANTTEASRADFLGYSIVENSQTERHHLVPIEGRTWHALKIRELALFPIRAGKLTIGPMKMGFEGRGYPGGRHQGSQRQSTPLTIDVSEPPLQGRPAGYRLGDVGRFKLSATVEPRQIGLGEAVSIVVKLEGTGNLPYKLKTPGQRGVEWLEPTLTDQIAPQDGLVGGNRKFTYVVRLDEPGAIELGAISLPYWDPAAARYEVASAALGTIQVAGSRAESLKPRADSRPDPLQNLVSPRAKLGPMPAQTVPWTERGWYWGALVAGPAFVMALAGSARFGRSVRSRWRLRKTSHARLAAQALDLARGQTKADAAEAATQVERAVFFAIEGATGFKARGVLQSELGTALIQRGVEAELASEVSELLAACDRLRFTGVSSEPAEQLVQRGADAVQALERGRTARRRTRTAA